MELDFIPNKLKKVAEENDATVTVTSLPRQSENFDYLSFAEVLVKNPKAAATVGLVHNLHNSDEYQLDAVKFTNNEFCDESPDILYTVLANILRGNIHKKKGILGKEKLFITDSDGNKYWPRGNNIRR